MLAQAIFPVKLSGLFDSLFSSSMISVWCSLIFTVEMIFLRLSIAYLMTFSFITWSLTVDSSAHAKVSNVLDRVNTCAGPPQSSVNPPKTSPRVIIISSSSSVSSSEIYHTYYIPIKKGNSSVLVLSGPKDWAMRDRFLTEFNLAN